jgi:hypothetical protein
VAGLALREGLVIELLVGKGLVLAGDHVELLVFLDGGLDVLGLLDLVFLGDAMLLLGGLLVGERGVGGGTCGRGGGLRCGSVLCFEKRGCC